MCTIWCKDFVHKGHVVAVHDIEVTEVTVNGDRLTCIFVRGFEKWLT